MLGAILGDIVGSPYEFDHNNYKHKDFPLLSEKSHFTDDTVMTAAVAVGLIDGKGLPERTFCAVQHEMRFWGREYPHAGYGGMFRRWLHAENYIQMLWLFSILLLVVRKIEKDRVWAVSCITLKVINFSGSIFCCSSTASFPAHFPTA